MRKFRGIIAISITLAAVLAVFGMSFSWVFIIETLPVDVNGTVKGYNFDMTVDSDSNGSLEHPFYITRPSHLINLQKLQSDNKLNSQTYYFEIGKPVEDGSTTLCTYGTDTSTVCSEGAGLDMTGTTMEPIGNNILPFIGVLEGNGFAITKATIVNPTGTNNMATYTDVGLFGTIGIPISDSATGTVLTRVSNLAVDEITIQSARSATGSEVHVGLFAGHIQSGTIEHIGAYKGKIVHNQSALLTSFSSDYSLVGRKAGNVDMDENPTQGTDAGGRLIMDIKKVWKDNGAELKAQQYYSVEGASAGNLTLSGQMKFYNNKSISIVREGTEGAPQYYYTTTPGLSTSRGGANYIPANELFDNDIDAANEISKYLFDEQTEIRSEYTSTTNIPNLRFNTTFSSNRNLVTVANLDVKIYERIAFFRPLTDGKIRVLCYTESASEGFALSEIKYDGVTPIAPKTSDFQAITKSSVTMYDKTGEKLSVTSSMLFYYNLDIKANTYYMIAGVSGIADSGYVFYIDFDGVSDTGGGSAGGSIESIDFTLAPKTIPDINNTEYVYSYVLIRFNDETEQAGFEIAFIRDESGVHVTSENTSLTVVKSGSGNATFNDTSLS